MSQRALSCYIIDDDLLSIGVMKEMVSQIDFLKLEGVFDKALDAVSALSQQPVDVIFLDVEMPEMNGLQLLSALNEKPSVVLITSKPEYAISAFDLEVTDYILKPVTMERFQLALDRIKPKEIKLDQEGVFIKIDTNLVRFSFNEINVIEAFGDYVKIHLDEKIHTVYMTLKSFEQQLPASMFIRVHRSFIVRLKAIDQISPSNLKIGQETISVSATYKQQLMERIKLL